MNANWKCVLPPAKSVAEFLEARIDEDETRANWALETARARHGDAVTHRTEDRYARILREVEAKREILRRWHALDERRDLNVATVARARVADEVIAVLAAIYRDHPDYRQALGSDDAEGQP